MSETQPTGAERNAALQDLFSSLGAVAEAGLEQGQEETVVLELPDETLDRAADIYRSSTLDS